MARLAEEQQEQVRKRKLEHDEAIAAAKRAKRPVGRPPKDPKPNQGAARSSRPSHQYDGATAVRVSLRVIAVTVQISVVESGVVVSLAGETVAVTMTSGWTPSSPR